jgi:hypothetical protein
MGLSGKGPAPRGPMIDGCRLGRGVFLSRSFAPVAPHSVRLPRAGNEEEDARQEQGGNNTVLLIDATTRIAQG